MKRRLWFALAFMAGAALGLSGCGQCDGCANEFLEVNNSNGACEGTVGGEPVRWEISHDKSYGWTAQDNTTTLVRLEYGDKLTITGPLPSTASDQAHKLPLGKGRKAWSVHGLEGVRGIQGSFGDVGRRPLGSLELLLKGGERLVCSFNVFIGPEEGTAGGCGALAEDLLDSSGGGGGGGGSFGD